MLGNVNFCFGLYDTDSVLSTLITENKGQPEHQRDGENKIPAHRATVANEFEVACTKNSVDAMKHWSGSQRMAGKIKKQIFQVWLADFHSIEP